MNPRRTVPFALLAAAVVTLAACGGGSSATNSTASEAQSQGASAPERASVVVTYPVLGSVVKEVVGDAADVTVLMPNGADPHEWSPSAKDIETMLAADLVIDNGLGLESNLQDPLAEAEAQGVDVFTVADHVTVRTIKAGEEGAHEEGEEHSHEEGTHEEGEEHSHEEGTHEEGEEHSHEEHSHEEGASDPHLWMDPLTMKEWVAPLVAALDAAGVETGDNGAMVESELDALNAEVAAILDTVPADRRKLVTGHESLGYLAERYGYTLVGAVIPAITSQAEASAGELAALAEKITAAGVPAVFTEIGTPAATVEAIAADTGAEVVELSTHTLPDDQSYHTFMVDIANTIAGALR